MRKLGFEEELLYKPVTKERCLEYYIDSRAVLFNNVKSMMPVSELINHNASANSQWLFDDGIKVSGTFNDEIVINYNSNRDALSLFNTYGFAVEVNKAYSSWLSINHPRYRSINIGRFFMEYDEFHGIREPKVFRDENRLNITFLQLSNSYNPELPAKIFSKIMLKNGMNVKDAISLFHGIQSENKKIYIRLLIELRGLNTPVADGLRDMAYYQLHALEY